METESHDVTAAMLLWLPDGTKPTPEDFESSDKISTRQYFRPSAVPLSTPSPHSSEAIVAIGSLGSRWDRKYSTLIMSRAHGAPSMRSKAEALTRHEVGGMVIGGQPMTDAVWWQHGVSYPDLPSFFPRQQRRR